MTQVTLEDVDSLINSVLPRRARGHNKEGHIHNLAFHKGAGSILEASATGDLTLTQTAQSITGNGNSSKVRLLLPTVGDWDVEATFDFHHTVAGGGNANGALYVNDSASAESGQAVFEPTGVRATVVQRWKVTTTVGNTPVELKAHKDAAGGTVLVKSVNTRITASGPAKGGATASAADHGGLTGLADDDHTQYLLANGGRNLTGNLAVSAGVTIDGVDISDHVVAADPHTVYGALAQAETWAALQTFGAGIATDTIAEKTAAAGVTIDGLLIKDGDASVFALLAGRAGAANDLTLTTSAATGTLAGSSNAAGTLTLRANTTDANGVLVLAGDSPHAALTGDLDVSGLGAFGNLAAINTSRALNVEASATGLGPIGGYFRMVATATSGSITLRGIQGTAQWSGSGTSVADNLRGSDLEVIHNSARQLTTMIGARYYMNSTALGTGVITTAKGLNVIAASWLGDVPAALYGIHIEDQANNGTFTGNTTYAIKIDQWTPTGGTHYGIHIITPGSGTVRPIWLQRAVGGSIPFSGIAGYMLFDDDIGLSTPTDGFGFMFYTPVTAAAGAGTTSAQFRVGNNATAGEGITAVGNSNILYGLMVDSLVSDGGFASVTGAMLALLGQINVATGTRYAILENVGSASDVGNVFLHPLTVGSVVSPLGILDIVGGTFAPAAGALGRIARISGTITEAASGVHARLMGLEITAPTITAGVATVTDAATLYISAKTGAVVTGYDYGLWLDEGAARFDGDGTHVFELPADATDPTGGGGAATGRIPVRIGGATKYLAYYG